MSEPEEMTDDEMREAHRIELEGMVATIVRGVIGSSPPEIEEVSRIVVREMNAYVKARWRHPLYGPTPKEETSSRVTA